MLLTTRSLTAKLAVLALLLGVAFSPGRVSAQAFTKGGTVIHPGDQIAVQVFGDQTLTQNVTVLNDGSIDYPLIGKVSLAGRTPDQAAQLLHDRLLKYVRHPVVTVAITQLAQPTVLVLGVVKNPGKYQLRSDARISDAIAAAGGLADNINGEYPDARISGPRGDVQEVSLQKLLRGGDSNLDERLGEGAVVYVPGPMQFNVSVSGAVDHPGVIAVNEGDRLSMAIAKAGNSMGAQSDLNNIRILRNEPNGQHQEIDVNLYEALKGGNMNADVVLQKDDTIYVPQARQRASRDAWLSGFFYTLTRFIP